MTRRHKVLFVCTGNSCRSQMAEGWARQLLADTVEAYSAGTSPRGLDPLAVQVMAEVGVDIAGGRSRHLDEFKDAGFDLIVTVCDNARQMCPTFPPPVRVMHAAFDDPPRLAESAGSTEQALAHYRRVRDEIRAFVEGLPRRLAEQTAKP